MPMIFAQPGEALFVTYYTSFFFPRSFSPVQSTLLRFGDPPLYVRGAGPIGRVQIPLCPIELSTGQTKIETSDKADVDVSVTVAIEPDLSGPVEDATRCVATFTPTSGQAACDEKQVKSSLELRLKQVLPMLQQYRFRDLVGVSQDSGAGPQSTGGQSVQAKLEEMIRQQFSDQGFRLIKGSCLLVCKYPKSLKELTRENIAHIPIISYLNEYEVERQQLLEKENEFKTQIDKLQRGFEKEKEEIERNFEKETAGIKKESNNLKVEARKLQKKYKEDFETVEADEEIAIKMIAKQAAVKEKTDLAEIAQSELEAEEKLATVNCKRELLAYTTQLEKDREKENLRFQDLQTCLNDSNVRLDAEKAKAKFDIELAQIMTNSKLDALWLDAIHQKEAIALQKEAMEVLFELEKCSEAGPVNLQQWAALADRNQQHKLAALDDAAEQHRLSAAAKTKHQIEMDVVELESKRQINQFLYNIVIRVLERQLVLAYANARQGERIETLDKLSQVFEKAFQGSKDAIQELRILASPGSDLGASISSGLREVVNLLFSGAPVVDELKKIFSEFSDGSSFAHSDSAVTDSDDSGASNGTQTSQENGNNTFTKNSTDYPV